jgi:hypothetical protein
LPRSHPQSLFSIRLHETNSSNSPLSESLRSLPRSSASAYRHVALSGRL